MPKEMPLTRLKTASNTIRGASDRLLGLIKSGLLGVGSDLLLDLVGRILATEGMSVFITTCTWTE